MGNGKAETETRTVLSRSQLLQRNRKPYPTRNDIARLCTGEASFEATVHFSSTGYFPGTAPHWLHQRMALPNGATTYHPWWVPVFDAHVDHSPGWPRGKS
jgi:hypothetical protein